jgi:tetratricopeptide (TPR) repeat protein
MSANPQAPEEKLQDFRDMRHSERIRLVLEQPGLDHWDVATEGMATAAVLGIRGEKAAGVRRTFEAANLYTRRFLDAHVKGDAAALAWLREPPERHGLGGVVSVEALPAAPPAPTPAELERVGRTRGDAAVVEALKQARASDPGAAVLAEGALNRLGYRLLARGQAGLAVDVLAIAIEKYPASANAQDSLAEALEAAGRHAEAVAASRKALELLDARPGTPAGAADPVRRSSQDRLRRLEKN